MIRITRPYLYEDVLALAESFAAEADDTPKGFIVSLTKKGLYGRLHFFGTCFRGLGTHDKKLRICWDEMPSEHDINSRCADFA